MDDETRKKLEEWNRTVGAGPIGEEAVDPLSTPQQTQNDTSHTKSTPTQKNPLSEVEQQNKKESAELLSRIRTYESDAAEAVNKRKASVSSIFLAQQRAQSGSNIKSTTSTNSSRSRGVFYLLASLVLVAGGVGLLYGWYTFVYLPQQESVEILENTFTLIPANKTDRFLFAVKDREDLVAALNGLRDNSPVAAGEFYTIHFVEEEMGPEEEIVVQSVSAREFLEKLEVDAPLPLYRSLNPEFTYGVHNTNLPSQENRPFLIMKTNFYQNAFASMLNWEVSLAEDLNFIAASPEEPPRPATTITENGTTTTASLGTTTDSLTEEVGTTTRSEDLELRPTNLEFKDEVIKNHDARVLRDSSNNVILLYSFADEETLIITNNTETLERIFERLSLVEFE